MTLDQILADATAALTAVQSIPELEQTKARFLGKTGSLTEQLKALGKLPPEEKKTAGAAINVVKTQVEDLINAAKRRILDAELAVKLAAEAIDVTLPGRRHGT
ncbi:MAG: phenylalanine--tRNA ligase subunit alpha, partial [Nitrosomonadaceae bacterium]|nr:phenylalanine--tRNA ligase subunit alpha [Nitrosomonadaceae bacterium]